jgi:hypothetical protein
LKNHPPAVAEVVLIGTVIGIVSGLSAISLCPRCRASLLQTFALPWRKEYKCPESGEGWGKKT